MLLGAVAGLIGVAAPGAAQGRQDGFVTVLEVSGLIDPVIVDYIGDALDRAEADGAEAVVLKLDSPGAVVDEAVLDALAFRLGHGPVPVGVWVGPTGAEARGGAVLLVTGAAIAGMAPDSRIGDAPAPALGDLPVELREGTVGPDEALALGVVDADEEQVAVLGTFIASLDGRTAAGRTLETADFEEVPGGPPQAELTVQGRLEELGLLPQLLHTVASPPVAYLLLVVALGLLVLEFFTAGIGVAAVVGAASLVLSGYGLAVLPTSPLGLGLMLLGAFGFAVDVQSGVPRLWTGIGTVAFAAGSVLLFDGVSVPWVAIAIGLVLYVLGMVSGMPSMVRSRFGTPTIGREWMVGEMGEATAEVRPDGVVRVRDALWPARTNRATPIPVGAAVRVVAIDGLVLEVEPEEGGAKDYRR